MFLSFISIFVFKSDLFITIILCFWLVFFIKFLSSCVSFSLLFSTRRIKSAFSIAFFDFSTPICSTISFVSLIPAVSMRFRFIPSRVRFASTMSLVVPGILVTMAFSSCISLFRILLFPTLGRPTIAIFIPFVINLLFLEFSIIWFKSCSMVFISCFILLVVISSMSWYSG